MSFFSTPRHRLNHDALLDISGNHKGDFDMEMCVCFFNQMKRKFFTSNLWPDREQFLEASFLTAHLFWSKFAHLSVLKLPKFFNISALKSCFKSAYSFQGKMTFHFIQSQMFAILDGSIVMFCMCYWSKHPFSPRTETVRLGRKWDLLQ